MSRRPPSTVAQLAALGLVLLSIKAAPVIAICPDAPILSNVDWYLTDSLAGCPAGDSLISPYMPSGIPSRMRVFLVYHDDTCGVKKKVPPDSIWVTITTIEGNVRVNDKATNGLTYADDSTNAQGEGRVTVPSFSGCGKVRVKLYVSHYYQGFIDVRVRTIDYNASGDVSDEALYTPCDVNYDGSANGFDNFIGFSPHQQGKHSHRFALHGTMVRRTNLAEGGGYPRPGASVDFWSPNNRWISFTVFTSKDDGCKVFLTASDPKDGNYLRQFSFNPPDTTGVRDYDPSWSPLGDVIVFDRDDWRVMKKGVPGVAGVTDTALHTLTLSGQRRG